MRSLRLGNGYWNTACENRNAHRSDQIIAAAGNHVGEVERLADADKQECRSVIVSRPRISFGGIKDFAYLPLRFAGRTRIRDQTQLSRSSTDEPGSPLSR